MLICNPHNAQFAQNTGW